MSADVLITGGAGFVGSNLALYLKERGFNVTALDNLKRRGSEVNIPHLRNAGVEFIHGDIRNPSDFPSKPYQIIVECSAEPSVLAGYNESPAYVIDTNLTGTINCLEYGRRSKSNMILLSTSRVYPVAPLVEANIEESETRYDFASHQTRIGITEKGVSEELAITGLGPRSIYGTTKASSELICEEYHHAYGMNITTTRFGVIAGPGQLAKPDQGIFSYWILRHMLKKPLRYIGFSRCVTCFMSTTCATLFYYKCLILPLGQGVFSMLVVAGKTHFHYAKLQSSVKRLQATK
jgi:CDP-paratose 2-epimerase